MHHLIRAVSPKAGLLAAMALALLFFAAAAPASPVAAAGDHNCSNSIGSLGQTNGFQPDRVRRAHDCIIRHHGSPNDTPVDNQGSDASVVASFYVAGFGCGHFLSDNTYSFDGTSSSTAVSTASIAVSGGYVGSPYIASAMDVVVGGNIVGYGVTVGPFIWIETLNNGMHGYSGIAWWC